jgi:hypothetical protein
LWRGEDSLWEGGLNVPFFNLKEIFLIITERFPGSREFEEISEKSL